MLQLKRLLVQLLDFVLTHFVQSTEILIASIKKNSYKTASPNPQQKSNSTCRKQGVSLSLTISKLFLVMCLYQYIRILWIDYKSSSSLNFCFNSFNSRSFTCDIWINKARQKCLLIWNKLYARSSFWASKQTKKINKFCKYQKVL